MQSMHKTGTFVVPCSASAEFALQVSSAGSRLIPQLNCRGGNLGIRWAVQQDLPWLNQMQRVHSGKLGFMYSTALVKAIAERKCLVAVDGGGCQFGFILWANPYLSRDDLTCVFQLGVAPAFHRRLIGASLVKAWFESLPFGVRLACCWCAQDLPANAFWQSVGFVPLAFRTGSRSKQRAHIFWQRRVRVGDSIDWWFPYKTAGGGLAEDRCVLPFPPGQDWSEALPTVLSQSSDTKMTAAGLPALSANEVARVHATASGEAKGLPVAGKSIVVEEARPVMTPQGIRFVGGSKNLSRAVKAERAASKPKVDVELLAKVRDLHDRFLHEVNAGGGMLVDRGRYEVGREWVADKRLSVVSELLALGDSGYKCDDALTNDRFGDEVIDLRANRTGDLE